MVCYGNGSHVWFSSQHLDQLASAPICGIGVSIPYEWNRSVGETDSAWCPPDTWRAKDFQILEEKCNFFHVQQGHLLRGGVAEAFKHLTRQTGAQWLLQGCLNRIGGQLPLAFRSWHTPRWVTNRINTRPGKRQSGTSSPHSMGIPTTDLQPDLSKDLPNFWARLAALTSQTHPLFIQGAILTGKPTDNAPFKISFLRLLNFFIVSMNTTIIPLHWNHFLKIHWCGLV